MSNDKPKFCVGEEVSIVGARTSAYDTERTEVVWSAFIGEGETITGYIGWAYKTEHQPDMNMFWHECSLRKIAKSEDDSFNSMMEKLKIKCEVKQ